MNFYSNRELKKKGFDILGKNLEISKDVNFYNFKGVIGSNCRIDDFSILIGKINIGNTTSSSIPLAIKELKKYKKLKKGDLILLSGFGVGYSWGSCIYKY